MRPPLAPHVSVFASSRAPAIPLALDKEIVQDENVHIGAEEAVERFLRPAHDRLVLVERGVQDNRNPRDGTSASVSNHSPTWERRMDGAKGRQVDQLQIQLSAGDRARERTTAWSWLD